MTGHPCQPDDAGSGTVLILGLVAVLMSACVAGAALFQVASARHRAESAADLAALAAVQVILDASASPPCVAAARVAGEAGAALTGCRVTGEQAWVTTSVTVDGLLTRIGPATAQAHAGPGQEESASGAGEP